MIDYLIPTSNLEIIRNAIFVTLNDDFAQQISLFGNTNCENVTFWQARTTPIDKEESAVIVISTFKGDDRNNQSIGSQHWDYKFTINVMTNAASTPTAKSWESAQFRVEKLIGIIRHSLMHPSNVTLGLDNIIEHTAVSAFQIYEDDRLTQGRGGDASGTAAGQILFTVFCEETTEPNTGIPLGQSDTNVLIGLTDRGYQYQVNG